MRVLVAPAEFAGTLTAREASEAIAEGWRRHASTDVLDVAPMSDGGRGFVEALHERGGELLAVQVSGADGQPVPGTVLVREDGAAYVESAQACGLHLRPERRRDPETATSFGVGQLLAAALDAGAVTVTVGLGDVAANDGGAGLLAALGATSDPPGALAGGAVRLGALRSVDLSVATARVAQARIIAATDVGNPLLGLVGTTSAHGGARGLPEDRKLAVDGMLERLAAATDKRTALAKGAGAGGGMGFALLLLGADLRPAVDLVAEAVALPERARRCDLVVTGEGSFDFSSRSGKVPYAVAELARKALRPCIALSGRVLVGSREMRALGIESAYATVDLVGEERSLEDPRGSLAALAQRVAGTWSRM